MPQPSNCFLWLHHEHAPSPPSQFLSDLITFRMNLVFNMKAEEAKLEE